MDKLVFEWDEKKRLQTIEKHGIDFISATELFEQRYYTYPSSRDGEERYVAIGVMHTEIIAVAYTKRGEVIRLITARKARKNEREHYTTLFH